MEFDACMMAGDSELMHKQSCANECRLFKNKFSFHHSTPKECTSRSVIDHNTSHCNYLCRDKTKFRPTEEKTYKTIATDISAADKRMINCATLKDIKKRKASHDQHRTNSKRTGIQTSSLASQPLTRCQQLLTEEVYQCTTPVNSGMTPYLYANRDHLDIKHSTPKAVENILEEDLDEDALWAGASAKVLQRVMSAPQLPGQPEFPEVKKLHHAMSLPQLWMPKHGSHHLHIWQRRLQVLNRKTEKMREKDQALKDRLEIIQKRADLLARSPVNTSPKQSDAKTSSVRGNNRCYVNAKMSTDVTTVRKPKVKKQVVHHQNNIYSCTLAKLIIGNPVLHTTWKDGQRCTYV